MRKRKRKFNKPVELTDENVTPNYLDLLGDYMDAAALTCVELTELRYAQRHDTTLVQAGTRLVPITLQQSSNDEITILEQRPKAAEEMLKVVKAALSVARNSELKLPEGKRKLTDGISLKAVAGIAAKARKDYGGDISRVVDTVRCTILAGDVNDLQVLSEIFRPCARGNLGDDIDFDVVRYRNEFNKVNPGKGDIRRLQINLSMPGADGHVGEILVFYGPSAEKYDKSRQAYQEQRVAEEGVKKAVLRNSGYETVKKVQKVAVKAEQKRRLANEEAADFPEVRALVMHQRAYTVNDFPVIINEDGHEGRKFAIVPNASSGFWETDQRFLDIIEHPDDYPDLYICETGLFEAKINGEALYRKRHTVEELNADMMR